MAIYRRISLRVIPLLMLLYLIAFLDRVNISFAALTMNADLGISNTVFGLGAGIFFIGYLLFEVPSNFMLVRVGARRWIGVLMVLWGALSVALGFVHSPATYLVFRFLIGAAEAGFFPGVVLYLTYWLPASVRARYMALFVVAVPLSTVIGGPLSVAILSLQGLAGLRGWQWLFLMEGLLAVLVGAMVPLLLDNGPAEAKWLSPDERDCLQRAIGREAKPAPAQGAWLPLLANRMLLTLIAAYFTLSVGIYGLGFWIPRILTSQGATVARSGWLAAVPYLFSAVGMILWCRHADARGERHWHLVLAYLCAAVGMAVGAATHVLAISLAGFCLAALGIFAAMPLYWANATEKLQGGVAVVAGVALVNAIGNLGGFVGPVCMGALLDRTHSFSAGLLSVAVTLACGAGLIVIADRRYRRTAA